MVHKTCGALVNMVHKMCGALVNIFPKKCGVLVNMLHKRQKFLTGYTNISSSGACSMQLGDELPFKGPPETLVL
jgi:hypothetical protein